MKSNVFLSSRKEASQNVALHIFNLWGKLFYLFYCDKLGKQFSFYFSHFLSVLFVNYRVTHYRIWATAKGDARLTAESSFNEELPERAAN